MENSPQVKSEGKSHGVLFPSQIISRLLTIAMIVSLPFIGGYIGYISAPEKIIEIASSTASYDTEDKQTTSEIKEKVRLIKPDGFIINDELFFSPTMGLLFSGLLQDISFTGSGFANCFREGCSKNIISILPYDNNLTPSEFLLEFIKETGVDPAQCKIEKLPKANPYSDDYAIYPKKDIEVTEQDLLDYSQNNHSEAVIKSLAEYQTYCKENLGCDFIEENIVQQKIFSLCSKYANTGSVGGYNRFMFPISGQTEALFVSFDGGNGDRGTLEAIQYTNRD